MKLKRRMPLLICVVFTALWQGCTRTPPDGAPVQIRFLNAMIPAGADSLIKVSVDGLFLLDTSGPVGHISDRHAFFGQRHSIRVVAHTASDVYGRDVMAKDLQFEEGREYTCVLTGEIPSTGIDSSATALLLFDDVYRHQPIGAIRLVNAAIDEDSCEMVWSGNPDSVFIGNVAHWQSSAYVPFRTGGYVFRVRGAATYEFLHIMEPEDTIGFSFYFIGAAKYARYPNALHVVVAADSL